MSACLPVCLLDCRIACMHHHLGQLSATSIQLTEESVTEPPQASGSVTVIAKNEHFMPAAK